MQRNTIHERSTDQDNQPKVPALHPVSSDRPLIKLPDPEEDGSSFYNISVQELISDMLAAEFVKVSRDGGGYDELLVCATKVEHGDFFVSGVIYRDDATIYDTGWIHEQDVYINVDKEYRTDRISAKEVVRTHRMAAEEQED